ncbi:MAG: ornithine carbamoyltransferase [Caldimonas sp.]
MKTVFPPVHDNRLEPLSVADACLLVDNARTLQRVVEAGRSGELLRGKNFGLLCASVDGDEAAAFCSAAIGLGAHVAHIVPSLTDASTHEVLVDTARMLGRLYDGIECVGETPAFVRRLAEAAGVPVYGGLASPDHPTAGLAARLGGCVTPAQSRRYVIQSVLLSTVG